MNNQLGVYKCSYYRRLIAPHPQPLPSASSGHRLMFPIGFLEAGIRHRPTFPALK